MQILPKNAKTIIHKVLDFMLKSNLERSNPSFETILVDNFWSRDLNKK